MEPEAKYTFVGTMVLILVASIVIVVVWLRGSGEGPDAREYKVYIEHQSLEGLEPRSYVTMRGMRVGSVTAMRFSSRRTGAIEVFIAVDPATPIRESTRATVERNLVTGLANLQLLNASEASPLLTQIPGGESYPVIAEGTSTLQQVSGTLTQLTQRVDETMQRVNGMLSPENQAAFSEILDTLPALAARYDTLGAQGTASLRDFGNAVRRMDAEVARLAQRADALLAASDEELRVTAQALRSAAASVSAAAARLPSPGEAIFGPPKDDLGPGEGAR